MPIPSRNAASHALGASSACWVVAALLCGGGCSDPQGKTQPVAAANSPPVEGRATPEAASAPPVDENEAAPPVDAANNQGDAAPQYVPPFPDRIELFVAPRRQRAAQQRDESNESVELLGFVNVDQPRAVLSIDGQVAPVARGDMKYGIEVISIEPPKVVLQRGRQRWPLSIEN